MTKEEINRVKKLLLEKIGQGLEFGLSDGQKFTNEETDIFLMCLIANLDNYTDERTKLMDDIFNSERSLRDKITLESL